MIRQTERPCPHCKGKMRRETPKGPVSVYCLLCEAPLEYREEPNGSG